jgi:hypothetical protein
MRRPSLKVSDSSLRIMPQIVGEGPKTFVKLRFGKLGHFARQIRTKALELGQHPEG